MNAGLIVLALGLGLVVWFLVAYNGLVRMRQGVKNAWSQIDVQLKRRHDLIPNLVEAVRGYLAHERQTLEHVTRARAQAVNADGLKARAEAENLLTQTLRSLFAVVERYPDLKATQNVLALQEELTSTENRIAFARQFYNDLVMRFNTRIQVVPTNVVASLFGIKEEAYFEIPVAEQEPVKVDLR